jgi:hypothetical protein
MMDFACISYPWIQTLTLAVFLHATDPKDYAFIGSENRFVGIFRGEWLLFGNLDKNGEFTEKARRKASEAGSTPTIINRLHKDVKKVYEFRSGRLIPGEMKDFVFVPEIGGKIIDFSDYKYSPSAPPIWNLPGRFIEKK